MKLWLGDWFWLLYSNWTSELQTSELQSKANLFNYLPEKKALPFNEKYSTCRLSCPNIHWGIKIGIKWKNQIQALNRMYKIILMQGIFSQNIAVSGIQLRSDVMKARLVCVHKLHSMLFTIFCIKSQYLVKFPNKKLHFAFFCSYDCLKTQVIGSKSCLESVRSVCFEFKC